MCVGASRANVLSRGHRVQSSPGSVRLSRGSARVLNPVNVQYGVRRRVQLRGLIYCCFVVASFSLHFLLRLCDCKILILLFLTSRGYLLLIIVVVRDTQFFIMTLNFDANKR
jgi:hypothetical protein